MAISGFQESVMLEELEKHFYRFTAEDYDRELSLYILDALKSLFTESELAGFAALLDDFVKAKESVLNFIYEEYSGDAYRNPLLFQPEAIAIFFWFDKDRYRLKAVWERILPLEELQRLADVWVVDIGLTI